MKIAMSAPYTPINVVVFAEQNEMNNKTYVLPEWPR
jgi:hypothetical protein